MSRGWQEQRRRVVEAARRMAELRLTIGTSGNVSMRLPVHNDGRMLMAITPSSAAYEGMRDEDILVTDMEMEPVDCDGIPSSEALLHAEIYMHRRDVGAVIHTHSAFATSAAVAGVDLPIMMDEMAFAIGGAVKVSKYAFPGSEALAANVREALGTRNAALIRNHGMVGVGADLDEALKVCEVVEHAAQVFVYASLLGNVTQLPADVAAGEKALFEMRRKGLEG